MNQALSITGLKEIYHKYEIFILDQWGVMHDGFFGYDNAIKCINQMYLDKKKLIIISNSSKKKITTKLRLPELGFDPKNFIEVMTSGEMIWQSLNTKNYYETKNLGKNCYYIYDESKEGDNKYIEGLDKFNFVEKIEEADFILGCTPFSNKQILDFFPILEIAKNNNLPFICANPDFETIKNGSEKSLYCMGAIAELYKNIGGKVFFFRKTKY